MMKQLLFRSLVLVILSAALGAAWNALNPRGYALVPKSKLAAGNVYLSVAEAKIKFDHDVALFIDARLSALHRASRIPGSLSIPASPESLSLKKIKNSFEDLSAPRELVIYCTGATCGSSEELADRLRGMGYSRRIYILREGFPGWERMGYRVEGDGASPE